MTPQEISAIAVADKYRPFNQQNTIENKLAWLLEEVEELKQGIANNDYANTNEEIGDVAFLLLHIASRVNPDKSILDYITEAKEKMEYRAIHGK